MLDFVRCLVVLMALEFGLSTGAFAGTTTLQISALIDGRDQLVIQGSTLQWHHFDYAAVGRIGGLDEPTVISTTFDGSAVLDHVAWIPDWPLPPPNEIRFAAVSSVFTGLSPAIPSENSFVTLTVVSARSILHLVQLPTSNDGFTTVLEFNDDGPGGPGQYDALLTFRTAPVPEPSAASLLAAGSVVLLILGCRRRQWRGITSLHDEDKCAALALAEDE
jgi:hypothetical protein